MRPHESLTIELSDNRIVVSGEIDLHTAPEMAASLLELAAEGERFDVDLSRVTFMDSQGVHALIEAQRARPRLRVVAVSPQVEHVLMITDTHRLLIDGVDATRKFFRQRLGDDWEALLILANAIAGPDATSDDAEAAQGRAVELVSEVCEDWTLATRELTAAAWPALWIRGTAHGDTSRVDDESRGSGSVITAA